MPRTRAGHGNAIGWPLSLALAAGLFAGCVDSNAPTELPHPNVILIVTDDLDASSLDPLSHVAARAEDGLTFSRFYITTPVCSPSRVSFLRGQYAHNHQVLGNESPDGGFSRFQQLGLEQSTVATWLHAAGYRTIFLGKHLNGYPGGQPTYVPPGWDRWFATFERYYDYVVNVNGHTIRYGSAPEDYEPDVLTAKTIEWIDEAVADGVPFFVMLSTRAPHWPPTPAPRHAGAYAGTPLPMPPSFNEADVSDKPAWIQALPFLADGDLADSTLFYQRRLETLLAVDEMFEAIMAELDKQGISGTTYVFFTSDNGFHIGQHRLPAGKGTAYEEDIQVPLSVWGPDVSVGVSRRIVANIDIAPTIAQLAGAPIPNFVDGRSLLPLVHEPTSPWRDDILIEEPGDFAALRSDDLLYVEWSDGERELYDMVDDPFQLESLHGAVPPDSLSALSARLGDLASCSGSTCR